MAKEKRTVLPRWLTSYDPDRDALQPAPNRRHRTAPNTQSVLTGNDALTPNRRGKVERYTELEAQSWEWKFEEAKANYGERTGELTEPEREEISRTKGLFLDKAIRLKPLWAADYSSEQAAEQITDYGFSWRTVKKYWSVFNRHFRR